jgi:hypothetical protein
VGDGEPTDAVAADVLPTAELVGEAVVDAASIELVTSGVLDAKLLEMDCAGVFLSLDDPGMTDGDS